MPLTPLQVDHALINHYDLIVELQTEILALCAKVADIERRLNMTPTGTDTDVLTFEQAEANFNQAAGNLAQAVAAVGVAQTALTTAQTAYEAAIAKLQADLAADATAAQNGTASN